MTAPTLHARRRRRPTASLRIIAGLDGGFSLEVATDPSLPPTALLIHSGELPTNARVAAAAHGRVIVADVPAGPNARARAEALGRVLLEDEVCRGDAAPTSIDAARLTVLLRGGRFPAEALVPREGGVEVRVSLDGFVRPVLVEPYLDGARLRHLLIGPWPGRDHADAASDQALRLNGRVRYARLALHASERHGHELHAEARLATADLTPDFTVRSVRAVAALAQHAAFSLHLLCGDADLRARYARLILGNQPIPHDPQESKETP